MREVDAIIIGTGQGGMPLAIELAREHQRVVIFEGNRIGGSCLNWGCTPSKCFLASAHSVGIARAAVQLGLEVSVKIYFDKVMERLRDMKNSWSAGSGKRLRDAGVDLILAEASFTKEGNVQGGGEVFSAPLAVINTGTSPFVPPIPGLEGKPYLTDHNFWDLTELPESTLVLGGGYVGLELGQGLAQLGSRVTIIDSQERIMGSESSDASQVIQEALERDGVDFSLGISVESVQYEGDAFRVKLKGDEALEGRALYVATGRKPNTAALNAEEAGLELDNRGFVEVDRHFQTSLFGVYAIGDVTGQPAFTHVSWEDHRRLLAILRGEDREQGDRVLGYAMFTEPQLGRAGLSMEQAKQKGYDAARARMEVKDMTRAIEWGQDLGFYEMVIDRDSDHILGATMVGYEAGELVQVFIALIEAGATWQSLDRMQNVHPTYMENLPTLARMFKDKGSTT